MMLNLFLLTLIVCFIVDISGFSDSFKVGVYRWITGTKGPLRWRGNFSDFSIKPFDCSLCMTWWCGLLYLCVTGQISIKGIAAVALYAVFATIISRAIETVKDLCGSFLNKIQP